MGGKRPRGPLIGVEGGIGWPDGGSDSVVRFNLGVLYRGGDVFGYGELDLWKYLGVSLGAGYGSRSQLQPVIGAWEGVPLCLSCPDGPFDDYGFSETILTLSIGYRWTGVHEIYIAPKLGTQGRFHSGA